MVIKGDSIKPNELANCCAVLGKFNQSFKDGIDLKLSNIISPNTTDADITAKITALYHKRMSDKGLEDSKG